MWRSNPVQLSALPIPTSHSHEHTTLDEEKTFDIPESMQYDYFHCRLRFLAYTPNTRVLNYFVDRAIAAIERDYDELPPMVKPVFERFRAEGDNMYKFYVLLVVVLASPTFQSEIYAFCDEYPMISFLKVLRIHFDAMLCGLSTTGTLCLEGEQERRYRSVYSFVCTMRSIIYTL